ncbi:nuclear factor interleukin-3-regulated -like protein [Labeo rohita]|uniref:Nuclear factor interleukin-3-regulated-like protein n=1 Tax=Labeo rohita TaxID=84645 RepID=A0A498NQ13_LABRO|nr:nuclear factor interleukin-3-regulated -like protein [Labeo rohita]
MRVLNTTAPSSTMSFTDEAVSILTSSSLLARSLLGRTTGLKRKEATSPNMSSARRKREFIPHEKKDEGYWDKRRKNNEAAKRSREKRRVNDMVLENRVLALLEENASPKVDRNLDEVSEIRAVCQKTPVSPHLVVPALGAPSSLKTD